MQQKLNTDLIRLWVEPATRESNNALYPLVAAGDKAARDQMIEANVGMVISKVEHFLAFLPRYRHLRDDLISSGMVGLVEAVNLMASGEKVDEPNPTGLIGLRIQWAIGTNTLESDETIRVPTRSRKRNRVPEKAISLSEEFSKTLSPAEMKKVSKMLSYDPRRMLDLRETLDACCENEMEREILRLREEGYVDREIADILDLPLTTTYVMRRTMYARFLELSGWKGEA